MGAEVKCRKLFCGLVLVLLVSFSVSAQDRSGALKLIDRIESDLRFTLQRLNALESSIPVLRLQIETLEQSLSVSEGLLAEQEKLLTSLNKQLADQLEEYDALLKDYRRLERSLRRWKVISVALGVACIVFIIL